MNKYFQYTCAILLLTASAQTTLAQNYSDDESGLDTVREKLMSANRTREELTSLNSELKKKLSKLQKEVGLSKKEVKELEYLYPHRVKSQREKSTINSKATSSLGGTTLDDPYIEEAQELYLSGQVIEQSDEQKLRELHLYDLQYQKQELVLDLRESEVLYAQVEEKRNAELQAMQDEIQAIELEEQSLRIKIMELEKAAMLYPTEIDLLKVENKSMEEKINRLRR